MVASLKRRLETSPNCRSFNPLHCGAVVASTGFIQPPSDRSIVSIPFIAGQWSLRKGGTRCSRRSDWFQSPSLRGSGRFQQGVRTLLVEAASFNPLHCGAVVASDYSTRPYVFQNGGFQSPSLRGSGRFVSEDISRVNRCCVSIPFIAGQWSLRTRRMAGGGGSRRVSIPFIAGQWSLRYRIIPFSWMSNARFNPLHCGAVVASRRRGPRRSAGRGRSFNPLHCGAVVASRPPPAAAGRRAPGFNPLHCGAVVASGRPSGLAAGPGGWFQSPSLRGSGRFPAARRCGSGRPPCVSIPFIAGQWSLLGKEVRDLAKGFTFQSPSLRGSGRFLIASFMTTDKGSDKFQSPSLRGSGRFAEGY